MQESCYTSFSRILQDTKPRNQQQPLNITGFQTCKTQPVPDCRSTRRSTDPSTGRPGGRQSAQQRVGSLQSVDRTVDRALSLCTLCTSVDRAGQPIFCLCGRSTGTVDRTTCSAAVVLFCCCFFLVLLSSTSSAITRQPFDDPLRLPQQ